MRGNADTEETAQLQHEADIDTFANDDDDEEHEEEQYTAKLKELHSQFHAQEQQEQVDGKHIHVAGWSASGLAPRPFMPCVAFPLFQLYSNPANVSDLECVE